MEKKKYLISACLAGHKCRFDGQAKPVSKIQKLVERGEAVLVCPEVDGGLSTPRPASEIVTEDGKIKVVTKTGRDVTDEFRKGAQVSLEKARQHGASVAILKAKSPSCGYGKIYDGTFSGKLVDGNGLTADLLSENGLSIYSELNFESEGDIGESQG
ncbi:hypothetical protein FUAX_37730 [Fulvitalea axinellae]|uniref:DUF523 domain-containing protein n=1 Tax=Fulvitalea axinellae TaxID=1182444 RepID=A0AAU9CQA4_9BACT|nr:hypothetical protein FUAX_37730 [Fulvitalea axinellae]